MKKVWFWNTLLIHDGLLARTQWRTEINKRGLARETVAKGAVFENSEVKKKGI
jgi:hypothetical protein